MASLIFETYGNSVIPHGLNIHKTASDIAIATMCDFLSNKHALPDWRCVFRCCENFPIIVPPGQDAYSDSPNACPKTHSHFYKVVLRYTFHGSCPFEGR